MDIKQKIEKANEEAANRLNMGDPVLVDIAPAGEVIPDPNIVRQWNSSGRDGAG